MKCDDIYFASRYNVFTDCVEWYYLPKTEIKVFFEKKMDIRGFGYISFVTIHFAFLSWKECLNYFSYKS